MKIKSKKDKRFRHNFKDISSGTGGNLRNPIVYYADQHL